MLLLAFRVKMFEGWKSEDDDEEMWAEAGTKSGNNEDIAQWKTDDNKKSTT